MRAGDRLEGRELPEYDSKREEEERGSRWWSVERGNLVNYMLVNVFIEDLQ